MGSHDTHDTHTMLRILSRTRCEEEGSQQPSAQSNQREPANVLVVPEGGTRIFSLGQVFVGWAALVSGSIGWSLYNPAHRTLRLSQRVIHARIHAQVVTIAALGVAAVVETTTRGPALEMQKRNVTFVTKRSDAALQ